MWSLACRDLFSACSAATLARRLAAFFLSRAAILRTLCWRAAMLDLFFCTLAFKPLISLSYPEVSILPSLPNVIPMPGR